MGFTTGSSSSYADWGLVAASNIFVQTPTVDLSPFSGLQAVLFAAVNDINIEQSVNFQGYGGTFEIFAFGKVNIANGTTVGFNGEFFAIGSPNSMSFNNVTFANTLGGFLLDSHNGDITMTNGGFNVGGGSFDMPADRFIGLSAPNGTISLTGPGNMMFIDFPVTNISIAARTLVLDHVRFPMGSSVYLYSANGMLAPNPNMGNSPLPGYVNFVNGVFYGGSPAQFFVGTDIIISPQ